MTRYPDDVMGGGRQQPVGCEGVLRRVRRGISSIPPGIDRKWRYDRGPGGPSLSYYFAIGIGTTSNLPLVELILHAGGGVPSHHFKVRRGPDGVHLFSRSSGLNILFDEVSVPAPAWSVSPRQVSVALTNACDLSCPHCYAPKYRARLNYDQVAKWLLELDEAGCLGVGFGGGEPTLHPDFARLCKFVSQSTQLAVTFTTHSHRLNERIVADLQGHVHFIRVSMDGVGSTYETLRGRSFGRFRGQLELVRMLAPFGVNFVVNEATLPDLDMAISIAIECGASEFLLLPERSTRTRTGIDARTRSALCRWVGASDKRIRLAVSEADKAGFPICDPLEREQGLRSYAHIDAAGTLKRSSFDEGGVLIGALGFCAALQQLQ